MRRKQARKLYALIGLALLVVLCFTGYAAAVVGQQFYADIVNRSGKETMTGKIFVSGQKMRTETMGNIMIMRPDKNVSWIVMTAERMYMEQPLNQQMLPKTSKDVEGEVDRVAMGTEMVDGKKADKFKVTYTQRRRMGDMACIGFLFACQNPQQRCLPTAVRPDQSYPFGGVQAGGYVIKKGL